MKYSKEQAVFIAEKVSDKGRIYIGDGNDKAYSLGIDEVLQQISKRWWNTNNGMYAILDVETINVLKTI